MTAGIIIACDGLACRSHSYIGLDELDDFHKLIKRTKNWIHDPENDKHYCSNCNKEFMDEEAEKDG